MKKIKYQTIKQIVFHNKKVPSRWKNKPGYSSLVQKLLNNDTILKRVVENIKNECRQKEYNGALKLSRQQKNINNDITNKGNRKRNKTQSELASYTYKKSDVEKNKNQKISQSFMITGMKPPKTIRKMKKASSMKEIF